MGQRTDTRERIVHSSLQAMREQGFTATAISDIVTASGAPRGSVTFHFPGGKDEIAGEVIKLRTSQVLAGVEDIAAANTSAKDFLLACIDAVADDFAASGFTAGCPVAPIAIERGTRAPVLRQTSADFFRAWRDSVARHLTGYGIESTRAARVSTLMVSAVEGALVISRTEETLDAIHAVRDELALLPLDADD
ncbi:MAG: hypothetical protein AVDCRST_MAG83-2693 [uncultured Arthrobacter sp.]|uniref:HTH tetR-type domain-containing protein n=1 Tax=uncultured Arthrobacter sp. TaxID=114050 RepID=A0A6J4ISP9_9MICC|nr:TetR/AcrR family transcriptional regulator [uncultured Arthrobacter sp.]CAA9260978.1 MAG: hypothetical protein AVDCRST_MAG83-2693 [uncultured Arthrobacter sp.]